MSPALEPGELVVRVDSFLQTGGEDRPWLKDSIAAFVARSLGQSPDFLVCKPNQSCRKATVTLRGEVRISDSLLSLTVRSDELFGLRVAEYAGHWEQWRAIADTVAYDLLRTLWRQSSPLAEWLPLKALPKKTAGFNRWRWAERLPRSSALCLRSEGCQPRRRR